MFPMLPKSRVSAVFALGVGCILLVAGLLLPRVVDPERPLPMSLSGTQLTVTDPESTLGAAYEPPAPAPAPAPGDAPAPEGEDHGEPPEGDGDKPADEHGDEPADEHGDEHRNDPPPPPEPVKAPVTKTWALTLGEPVDDDGVAATVGVTSVRNDRVTTGEGDNAPTDDQGALLDAAVWSMQLDRHDAVATGDVKVSDRLGSPATGAEVPGQWVAFPRNAGERTYPFFDSLLRRDLPADFDRTAEIDGHRVNVYRQNFEAEPVLQANPYFYRLTSPLPDGRQATLQRSGSREITVEPSSGLIVGLREDLHDYYAGPDGAESALLQDFHGQTPDDEVAGLLTTAADQGKDRPSRTWGVALAVAGAIVALGSAVIALKPAASGGGRPAKASRRTGRGRKARHRD
ncbi:MAG TPA: DUF3068 domain-containing protein [Corynebacterium nuruki]|jgi:hypothetical protein|uniref:DUF3068 domain-containing protein n=2 Tax=Corynebacterium nuruki TaxID=1032851 RepID=A0A3D4T219_9CORY|nr:DUF3068 domain-containing protein [Corynebacterium nuruki]